MRKLIYGFAAWLLLVVTMAGCTYKQGEMPAPVTTATSTTTAVVSYKTDIVPIMVTYCLGINGQSCHVSNSNQSAPGDYTNYNVLKAKIDNGVFQNRVFNASSGLPPMPPSYSTGPQTIAPSDLAKLKSWIAAGAPNN